MDSITKHNKQLGSALVAEAEARAQEQRKEKCLSFATEIVRRKDDAIRTVQWGAACKEHFEAQLEALERGLFDYNQAWNKITFHDKALNEIQPPVPTK